MGQEYRVQGTDGRSWKDVGRGVEECGGRGKVCGGRGGGEFGRVVFGWVR